MNRFILIGLVAIAATTAACTGPHLGGIAVVVVTAVVLLVAASAFAQASGSAGDDATSTPDAYAGGDDTSRVGPCLRVAPPDTYEDEFDPDIPDDVDNGDDDNESITPDDDSDADDDDDSGDDDDDGSDVDDDDDNGDDGDDGSDTDKDDGSDNDDDDSDDDRTGTQGGDEEPTYICLSPDPDIDLKFDPHDGSGEHTDPSDDKRKLLDKRAEHLPEDVVSRLEDDIL